MITNWNEFEEWRRISLAYHSNYGMDRGTYNNALTFFEYARRYFQLNGFPDDNRPVFKSGANKGNKKPWSKKDIETQQQAIRNFIKNEL